MTEQDPTSVDQIEHRHTIRDGVRSFMVGAVVTGIVFTGWNTLTESTDESSEPTLPPSPAATALESPSPDDIFTPLPPEVLPPSPAATVAPLQTESSSPSATESATSSPEIVVEGRPNRFIIPGLVDTVIDYSDGYSEKPNDCGKYSDPCPGQVEIHVQQQYNLGVVGVDKLSKVTAHTSYYDEPDVGAVFVSNPIDSYTSDTGLQVGDRLEFHGYDDGATVSIEIMPFPDGMSEGKPVPNSVARYISKQEGQPLAQRTDTADFIDDLYEQIANDEYMYAAFVTSYGGTGENGFEMSPDGSGRANSVIVLGRVAQQ